MRLDGSLLHLGIFCCLLVVVCSQILQILPEQDGRRHIGKERRAVFTGVATAGLVLNALSGLLGGLLGGNKNQIDAILVGRSIRINLNGNCATATDLDSQYKSEKCAENSQQAAALAAEELVTVLIKLGIISYDDQHLRPPPVTRPPKDCEDTVSQRKCMYHIKIGHCHIGSPYFHWMHEHCYMTCTACNPLDKIFPNGVPKSQG